MRKLIVVGLAAGLVGVSEVAAQVRERAPARVEVLPPDAYVDAVKRSELRERAIEGLIELASNPEAQVRANAIEGLAQAPARAVGAVRAGMSDKNLGVRFAAAYAAGRWGIRDVVPSLERLLGDPSADVRAAALYGLKKNGVDVDLTPLASMLESGEVRLRRNAAMILGDLGDGSATGMLNAAAKSAKQPGMPSEQRITRLIIAEALVKLGDPEAIHAIRAALFPATDRDVEAAVSAAQSLGLLQDRESVGELVNRIEYRVSPETPERPGSAGGGGGGGGGPGLGEAAVRDAGGVAAGGGAGAGADGVPGGVARGGAVLEGASGGVAGAGGDGDGGDGGPRGVAGAGGDDEGWVGGGACVGVFGGAQGAGPDRGDGALTTA